MAIDAVKRIEPEFIYKAADGQEVKLSIETVKKFLVHGKPELVTNQEIMFFLHICRARKLNPFTKDCYLIKFSNDPAAIVTSVDFFRKRARVQPDCRGWQAGPIVRQPDGKLRDSLGLVLDGEEVVGGWFEAKPAGWEINRRIEVNLKGYIRKTKEGNITRFWQEDNWPTMITKVAESQGLRMVWPDEFQGMVTSEEAQTDHPGEIIDLEKGLAEPTFEDLIKGKDVSQLDAYIDEIASANNTSADNVKIDACKDFNNFWLIFEKWNKRKLTPAQTPAEKVTNIGSKRGKVKTEPEKAEPPQDQPQTESKVEVEDPMSSDCPDTGESYKKSYCQEKCSGFIGCPAWGKES